MLTSLPHHVICSYKKYVITVPSYSTCNSCPTKPFLLNCVLSIHYFNATLPSSPHSPPPPLPSPPTPVPSSGRPVDREAFLIKLPHGRSCVLKAAKPATWVSHFQDSIKEAEQCCNCRANRESFITPNFEGNVSGQCPSILFLSHA